MGHINPKPSKIISSTKIKIMSSFWIHFKDKDMILHKKNQLLGVLFAYRLLQIFEKG